MPWEKSSKYGGFDKYCIPVWFCNISWEHIEFAKIKRKESAQLREVFLSYQKTCGQQGNRDTARYFREEAAEQMKIFRGFDLAIKWMEGDYGMDNWRYPLASEAISPYIDRAFIAIDYMI